MDMHEVGAEMSTAAEQQATIDPSTAPSRAMTGADAPAAETQVMTSVPEISTNTNAEADPAAPAKSAGGDDAHVAVLAVTVALTRNPTLQGAREWRIVPPCVSTYCYICGVQQGEAVSPLSLAPDCYWFMILIMAISWLTIKAIDFRSVEWQWRVLFGLTGPIFGGLFGVAGWVVRKRKPFGADMQRFASELLLPFGIFVVTAHTVLIGIRYSGCSLSRMGQWGFVIPCTIAQAPIFALCLVFWRQSAQSQGEDALLARRLVGGACVTLAVLLFARLLCACTSGFQADEWERQYMGITGGSQCNLSLVR